MGNHFSRAAFAALIVVAPGWLGIEAAAQSTAQAQSRELPVFEVDPTWPKIPPQWKVGEVSHINADAQGNVYLLLVGRKSLETIETIKPPGSIGGGHMIGADPSGNIYVASPARGVQKLAFKGMTALH